MNKVDVLVAKLKSGQIYRRSELAKWSNAVDRHIAELVKAGILKKISPGCYLVKEIVTGAKVLPATPTAAIKAFLKDDRFLLLTPEVFAEYGLQAVNSHSMPCVYNRKRHGVFALDGCEYKFWKKPYYPDKAFKEFLIVDTVNNMALANNKHRLEARVRKTVQDLNSTKKLKDAIKQYGGITAEAFFRDMIN